MPRYNIENPYFRAQYPQHLFPWMYKEEVKKVKKFSLTRGFCADNTETVIRNGLVIYNEVSKSIEDHTLPPGPFFIIDELPKHTFGGMFSDRPLDGAEEWAKRVSKKTNNIPHTAEMIVTEANFPILAGRIYHGIVGHGHIREAAYTPVNYFEQMCDYGSPINLEGLTMEDFKALACKIGIENGNGEFEYTSYEELFRKYA